jgi:hypothetical protein
MEFVRNLMRKISRLLADERGNVESSLVLVPLLILFLVGMQLATTVHARNTTLLEAQADATRRAISGEFVSGDEFIHIDTSGDGQNLDLLVTSRRMSVMDLLPGFLSGQSSRREINLHGLSIIENQR